VTAHDGVLGGLDVCAKVGDSEAAEVRWEVQEAFGETKVKLQDFVEKFVDARCQFVVYCERPCHMLEAIY
jgi:hypothetical protein